MKTARLKIEIILTVICLVMVYALATREYAAPPATYNINVIKPASTYNAYESHMATNDDAIMDRINSYDVAGHIRDQDVLETLARKEAQNMVQTGDVSKYQQELEKHGLLMSVLGY